MVIQIESSITDLTDNKLPQHVESRATKHITPKFKWRIALHFFKMKKIRKTSVYLKKKKKGKG